MMVGSYYGNTEKKEGENIRRRGGRNRRKRERRKGKRRGKGRRGDKTIKEIEGRWRRKG